ncbi:MAG TPA: hypothetical protein PKD96_01915 [Candidatus Absconditabacterales bacterium]|nr:hypothetical protein [Candidatus Absconditabacterales bacterium]HMT27035.1 hypothetical protein [Candidatus Absconditabacterales bacterium]
MKKLIILLVLAIAGFLGYKLYINDGTLKQYMNFFSNNSGEIITGGINKIDSGAVIAETLHIDYKIPVILDSERQETFNVKRENGGMGIAGEVIVIGYIKPFEGIVNETMGWECGAKMYGKSGEFIGINECGKKEFYGLVVIDSSDKDIFNKDFYAYGKGRIGSICLNEGQLNFNAPYGKASKDFILSKEKSQKLLDSSKDRPLKIKLKSSVPGGYDGGFNYCHFAFNEIEIIE